MRNNQELILIPKYQKYIEYVLNLILKLPRVEKFNIGNEYKSLMYENLRDVMYINKLPVDKRMYYLNKIDADLNVQRIFLRIMNKNGWIDFKKFNVAMELISEIGKILGGLIGHYGKNIKERV